MKRIGSVISNTAVWSYGCEYNGEAGGKKRLERTGQFESKKYWKPPKGSNERDKEETEKGHISKKLSDCQDAWDQEETCRMFLRFSAW